jgi:hypothetical protein
VEPAREGAPNPPGQLGGDDRGAGGCSGGGQNTGDGTTGGEGPALPCQDSHKCNGTGALTPSSRRTAMALQLNVAGMIDRHGISQVGFLTLTFRDHVVDPKVAQRRMHSLVTGVLKPRYGEVITVMERQKSGRIHFHSLVACAGDIRTGIDFDALARRDYRSAPEALRREWAFWRATARSYGFGRTELLPVRSCAQAMGKYVGKYIGKHLEARQPSDKRVRLVRYTGPKIASTRFAWASPGARAWRQKLAAFVAMLHEAGAIAAPTTEAMARKFGSKWAYEWRDNIMTFPLPEG